MATFTSNQNNVFELSFAGTPLLLDTARTIRMAQPHAEQESDTCNTPPRKYQPLAEICEELDRLMPWSTLQDFHLPINYPGRNLGAIARHEFRGPYPCPEVKCNTWYYPPTATRWSVFRGLATSTAVQAMLQATTSLTVPASSMTSTLSTFTGRDELTGSATFTSTQATAQNANPGEFVMLANPLSPDNPSFNANLYTLSSQMFLLPPRALAEHGEQFDGLYLITLVDERYWWQFSPLSLQVRGSTTWDGLIGQLATALGITITADPTPTVYGQPEADSPLWCNFESAGVLLDAVAYNTGRVVVRLLDGTYVLRRPVDSQAIVNTNRLTAPKLVRLAGGDIFYSGNMSLKVGDLGPSRNTVIPELVSVSFPVYIAGDDPVPHFSNPRYQNQRPSAWYEDSFGETYDIPVPIASGNLDLKLGGTSGYIHSIHGTAKALVTFEKDATATNASGLTALSMQLAQDYYQSQVATALDETYPGSLAWIPEGIHDIVWTYSARSRQASTRVLKTQWNQFVRDMQHATPPVFGFSNTPKGVGGPSVAQTIRDSCSGSIVQNTLLTAQLGADATATDSFLQFKKVDYFPTQNRWRGTVDTETILFEGTSGGIAIGQNSKVSVVYRGIDGTLAAAHTAGAVISQVAPDVSYGVNLTTYEKSQFIYPNEWTSGGIQGVNIVPELQTVQVLDGKGVLINKITHYSGRVQAYDSTQLSGFQWFNEELIWAVERTGLTVSSGFRYGGQLTGYSASGMVAPVYAIGDGSAGTGGGTGTSLIVEQVDLAVVVPNVQTIQFDQADGFKVSSPAPTIARIDLTPTGTGTGIETGQYDSTNPLGDEDTIGVVTQLFFDADAGFAATGAGGDPGLVSIGNVFLGTNNVIAWPRGKVNPDGTFNQVVGITSADNPRINGVAFPSINLDLFVPGLDLILNANGDGSHSAALLLFGGGSNNQGPVFPQYAISTTTGIGFGIDADGDGLNLKIRGGIVVGAIPPIGPSTVPNGGTGVTTFTSNGVLFGNGTDPLQVTAAGSTGQVLFAGSAPFFASFSAGFPVSDATVLLQGSSDSTKHLRLEIDGFTTGTTRVLTPQDASYTLAGLETAQTFTTTQTFSASPTAPFGSGVNCERFGAGAGNNSATGHDNFAIGSQCMPALTIGNYNVGLGSNACQVLTTGLNNIGIGAFSLQAVTTGSRNVSLGGMDLNASGVNENVCIGNSSLRSIQGDRNIAIGYNTHNSTGSPQYSIAIGYANFSNLTTSCNRNIAIGYAAANNNLVNGADNICIGSSTDTAAGNTAHAVALGDSAVAASNEFALGPNLNFQTWYGVSSTSTTRQRADLTVSWISSTDASRKARFVLNVWDTVAREVARADTDGSGSNWSFFGAGSFGSGRNVIFVNNATVTPSSAPTGGYIEYATNGTPHYFPVNGSVVAVGGAIVDHYADANNTGTTETDLYSDSLPANTFNVNGDKIRASYGGIFTGAVSATQQLRAYFAGTLVFDSGALSIGVASPDWTLDLLLIRESSSIVRVRAGFLSSSAGTLAADADYVKVTGLTLSGANTLKVTGTAAGIGGASNQITASMGTLEFLPAA